MTDQIKASVKARSRINTTHTCAHTHTHTHTYTHTIKVSDWNRIWALQRRAVLAVWREVNVGKPERAVSPQKIPAHSTRSSIQKGTTHIIQKALGDLDEGDKGHEDAADDVVQLDRHRAERMVLTMHHLQFWKQAS